VQQHERNSALQKAIRIAELQLSTLGFEPFRCNKHAGHNSALQIAIRIADRTGLAQRPT